MRDMQKGAITMLDILGWKGIWERHEDPVGELKKVRDITRINIEGTQQTLIDCWKYHKNFSTRYLTFSDTIVIINFGEPKETINFQICMTSAIIVNCIRNGLPMRGAISYGDLYVEDTIFMGPAVDEVAENHQKLQLIGCYLAKPMTKDFKVSYIDLIDYLIPMKNGKINGKLINWVDSWINYYGYSYEDLKKLLSVMEDSGLCAQNIREKYANTWDFIKYVFEDDHKR